MASMVLGIFASRISANDALIKLEDSGYNPKDISIVTKNQSVTANTARVDNSTVGEKVVGGAATGGVIGALAGLLVGIGAIAIPGIGGVLIGGPIAAALGLGGTAAAAVSGAATGVVAGGIIGGLTALGVPEEDARVYEQRIQEGGVLIAVPARDGESVDARSILEKFGAEQVRVLNLHDF